MDIQGKTGVSNTVYDLVSVLYHCLQGAETCEKYIEDAQNSGDNDLVQFFRDVQQQDRQCAERCQDLLSHCLVQKGSTTGIRKAA